MNNEQAVMCAEFVGVEEPLVCKKCKKQLKMRVNKMGQKRWVCQECHNINARTIYRASRDAALLRRRNDPAYKESRRQSAIEECGVPSQTSVFSKRSEAFATQARTSWTLVDDDVLMNGGYTQGQLARLLGRSIRAIQRRKAKLREKLGEDEVTANISAITPLFAN